MIANISGWKKESAELEIIRSFSKFLIQEKNHGAIDFGEAQIGGKLPFSFIYGGKESGSFLHGWKHEHRRLDAHQGREKHEITWTDPDTGLAVTCEVTLFTDFPAVEWVLRFTNYGSEDTPILENIRALDTNVSIPETSQVTLHHSHGSSCTATDFLPMDEKIYPHQSITLAPDEGRSSFPHLPFFNLEWPDGGLVGAIGWSGQWEMSLSRDTEGKLSIKAGQQTTHLALHPGESIRTPRMLLVGWLGDDPIRGNNLLRRLMLEHYIPKLDGKPITPPMAQLTWFAFNTGNDVNEENQIEVMKGMPELGVEAFWIDAGWFEGGWPGGVGSWHPKPEAFPNGLKPLGDKAHELGMKFVVWFEPERVHHTSRIAKEHPEWVLHFPDESVDWGSLFDLGNPEARRWMTDHLSKCIAEWGIDVFRNDFNIGPLPFLKHLDTSDRQGMSEIRYIEGLYAMWDELLERHPGLMIDNCASGGRRIDLETCSRSIPLWRSDTQCGYEARQAWDQGQTAGLSLYVPLHSAGVWGFDAYSFRSVATLGTNICPDTRKADFPKEQTIEMIEEMKSLRPYWLGDFYPLTSINTDDQLWCGWQLYRPDMGEGFAMIFRRKDSPYPKIEVALKGLDPDARYKVLFVDSDEGCVMTGRELSELTLELETPASSMLIRYKKH